MTKDQKPKDQKPKPKKRKRRASAGFVPPSGRKFPRAGKRLSATVSLIPAMVEDMILGDMNAKEVAAKHGVHYQTIANYRRRQEWADAVVELLGDCESDTWRVKAWLVLQEGLSSDDEKVRISTACEMLDRLDPLRHLPTTAAVQVNVQQNSATFAHVSKEDVLAEARRIAGVDDADGS